MFGGSSMRRAALALLPLLPLLAGALDAEECEAGAPECAARGESFIQRAQAAQLHRAEAEHGRFSQGSPQRQERAHEQAMKQAHEHAQAVARAHAQAQAKGEAKGQNAGRPAEKAVAIAEGETLGWLNSIIGHVWPKINELVTKIVHEEVGKAMNKDLPPPLKGLKLFKLTLGERTPQLGPISSYKSIHGGSKIRLGVDFDSDMHFEVGYDYMKAGVQKLQITGELTVMLDQFIDEPPLVGGVVAYFVKTPTITSKFSEALEGLDIFFTNVARMALEELVVLPNYIPVPLAGANKGVDRTMIRTLPPRGALRLTLLGAKLDNGQDSAPADGEGGLYVKCSLVDQLWDSKPVSGSRHPTWDADNVADFLVLDREQNVQVELNKVDAEQDVQLGKLAFPVGDVEKHGAVHEQQLRGKDGQVVGSVRFKAEWFGADVDGQGDFDKSLLVVKVFGVDMPGTPGVFDEVAIRAEVPGVPAQTTQVEGLLVGMHKAIRKISEKAGAEFMDFTVDRALFFLVPSHGGEAHMETSLTLQDGVGDVLSEEPVKVDISKVSVQHPLDGSFVFKTEKGSATAKIRFEAWGLKRNL